MAAVDVRTGRDIPAEVQEFLKGAGVLIIDGQERPGADGESFDTVDPATEETLAQIPQATAEDVDAAVSAAKRAHLDGRWRGLAPVKRARILYKVGDAMAHRSIVDTRNILDLTAEAARDGGSVTAAAAGARRRRPVRAPGSGALRARHARRRLRGAGAAGIRLEGDGRPLRGRGGRHSPFSRRARPQALLEGLAE